MSEVLSGAEFKKQLRAGVPKLGLFVNSHSPTVAEQLAHSGYDWLLIDTQHGPMNYTTLSTMLAGVSSGGAKSLVRVAGYQDRAGIQQSLDMGADGVLVPYINNAEEARQAVSCCKYPTAGTRSVYFPQRSMNKDGLLGYAGNWNKNAIVALQVETASCIENIEEIALFRGHDISLISRLTHHRLTNSIKIGVSVVSRQGARRGCLPGRRSSVFRGDGRPEHSGRDRKRATTRGDISRRFVLS